MSVTEREKERNSWRGSEREGVIERRRETQKRRRERSTIERGETAPHSG